MKRYLPPLLVLAVLGALLFRTLNRPSVEADQERIMATWAETGSQERGIGLTRTYASTHTTEADIRFATESWVRLGQFGVAVDTMFGEPSTEVDPARAREFARLALTAMGWRDRARTLPRPWTLPVEVALVEGGTPWMENELRTRALEASVDATATHLRRAARFGNRTSIELIINAFRARKDLKGLPARHARFLVGVATQGVPGADARDEDRALLLDILRKERLRESGGWAQCVLALGRTADPEVLTLLRRERTALLRTGTERDERDAAVLNAGLWAGGDGGAEQRARTWAQDAAWDPQLVDVYTEAGIHRFLQGDERARRIVGRVWESFGAEFKPVRYRIAFGLLFQLEAPVTGKPPQNMVRDLDADPNPSGRVLGAAYRLRMGETAAVTEIIQLLRSATTSNAEPVSIRDAWIFGLRALLLYTP